MTVFLKNGLIKQQRNNSDLIESSEINLLVVNLMPNKLETERQFIHLLSDLNVDVTVTFLRMATHNSKSVPESALERTYVTLDDCYQNHYDGLIVTGAPVEQLAFEDVDYWDEFLTLMDWRLTHVTRSLFECWASQAALYADFGIQKQVVSQKLFGIYRCEINEVTDLTRGFNQLSMPQSRHATLGQINDERLSVLASDPEAGPVVLAAEDTRSTYISGHPEYETGTLFNEFHRDLAKGCEIQLPKNYFSAAIPSNTWYKDSIHLYNNWIASLSRVVTNK